MIWFQLPVITSSLSAGRTAFTVLVALTLIASILSAFVASVMGGSTPGLGGLVFSFVGSLQFFALTSDLSVNLSPTYAALGCSIQWINYQVPIFIAPGGDPLSFNCGWSSSPSYQYVKMALVAITGLSLLSLHKAILYIAVLMKGRLDLPSILSYPRVELVFLLTTIIGLSEAMALLFASGGAVGSTAAIGILALALLAIAGTVLVAMAALLIRARPLLAWGYIQREDLLLSMIFQPKEKESLPRGMSGRWANDEVQGPLDEALNLSKSKTEEQFASEPRILAPIVDLWKKVSLASDHLCQARDKGRGEGLMGLGLMETSLIRIQLTDRLGSLFDDLSVDSNTKIASFLIQVGVDAVCGVLVGIQRGAQILPTSPSSTALTALMMAAKTVQFLFIVLVQPQAFVSSLWIDGLACGLEALTIACVVALSYYPFSNPLQNAMLGFIIAALGIKFMAIWLLMIRRMVRQRSTFVGAAALSSKVEKTQRQLSVAMTTPINPMDASNSMPETDQGTEVVQSLPYAHRDQFDDGRGVGASQNPLFNRNTHRSQISVVLSECSSVAVAPRYDHDLKWSTLVEEQEGIDYQR